jgi:hypothetical protein
LPSRSGLVAYTQGGADKLADSAVAPIRGGTSKTLTDLSSDLFDQRDLGRLEETWVPSFDGRRIQAWIITPPGFDPAKKYPMVLEIHGGPFGAYGPMFATEPRLMAAVGYVVVYANPRGSTSYGKEFGNAIEELILVNKHVINLLKEYNPSTAYDLKKYYPDLFKKFQEQRLKEMFNWVLNNIKRGKKEGLYRNELDEHIIAKLFVHRNEVLIIESDTFDLNEFTSNKFISEMIIYHIRGIATEKGIEVLNKNQNNIIENEM